MIAKRRLSLAFSVSFLIFAGTFVAAVSSARVAALRPESQAPGTDRTVRELDSPAGPGSGEPELSVSGKELVLSWVEPTPEKGHALRFSRFAGNAWSSPITVARGANWFVNWADFPSVAPQPDGSLVAHWLVMSGAGRYAYDVHISRSADGGKTWSRPIVPHRDKTQTEHGFVSLLAWTRARTGAVWLDGRKFAAPQPAKTAGAPQHDAGHGASHNEMTLRFAALAPDGSLAEEAELDGRVCECCQTSAALIEGGAIVVYRDRSKDEIRDMSYVRYQNGKWSEPRPLHADGWQIHGCPVNGPAVAAQGKRVAVAWFTGANDVPKVKLVFSDDAGATFGAPVEISSGKTIGRVDTALLADGSALVVWMEGTEQSAAIMARRVPAKGAPGAPFVIQQTSASRKSGFPRIARIGNQLFFAWTEIAKPGAAARVRTASMNLP